MNSIVIFMMTLSALLFLDTASAGEDKKAEPQLRLEVDLVDGSHIIGVPGIESVPVQTSYAKMGMTDYSGPHIGGGCYFKGGLDEVMVFNRSLTAEEVKRIYAAQK